MTWKQYLEASSRTEPLTDDILSALYSYSDPKIRLLHGAIGFATELGELKISNHDLHFEERGDCFWYLALLTRLLHDCGFTIPASYVLLNIRDYHPAKPANYDPVLAELDNVSMCLLDLAKRFMFYDACPCWLTVSFLVGRAVDLLCSLGFGVRGFEGVLQGNIDKLRTRFPDKFSNDAAVNRDLAAEAKALKGEVSE